MDPHCSAPNEHLCDLCETAIVQSYCDYCHVNLCKPCIGEHISDEYEKHKIVRFQDRKSTLIYPKCVMHPQKNCKYQCKNCDTDNCVCSSCTTSEQHRGHVFIDILEVYKTMKKIIEKDTEEFENLIPPKYEEVALDLENQLANLDGRYQKFTEEISKQGDEWHKEIDIIIDKMNTEMSEIKMKHRDILQKHLDEIKQIQSLINKAILVTKEMKESREIFFIIKYRSKIREFSEFPPTITVTLPTFLPKSINREKLYDLFGHITPLYTVTKKNGSSLNLPDTSVRELLDKPETVATIETGCERIFSVTCQNEDNIWTSGETSVIKSFNSKGSLHQTDMFITKSGHRPRDIAVDVNGDLLYSDDSSNTVNTVKNGQTYVLIRFQGWVPTELCITPSGDLLVTMYSGDFTQSKVVRYSGSTEKQTIQFDDIGKPLYSVNSYIKYITENRNHDICVADFLAGAIVVVNQDGKLRWRYTGHPSVTKNKPFKPRGITTDSQSRILTVDCYNQSIHILYQNGQFLRYIDNCDLEDPYGLCVDNNDNLFVCESHKGNVKKIKYLK